MCCKIFRLFLFPFHVTERQFQIVIYKFLTKRNIYIFLEQYKKYQCYQQQTEIGITNNTLLTTNINDTAFIHLCILMESKHFALHLAKFQNVSVLPAFK